MLKQKAPKDMTVEEFIDLVEARYHTADPTNMNSWINTLRMIADEPAPNPFTEDQLAWMRNERRKGLNYAACNKDGQAMSFKHKPSREDITWFDDTGYAYYRRMSFLEDVLSWDDPEPLCFADYAPLEGEGK